MSLSLVHQDRGADRVLKSPWVHHSPSPNQEAGEHSPAPHTVLQASVLLCACEEKPWNQLQCLPIRSEPGIATPRRLLEAPQPCSMSQTSGQMEWERGIDKSGFWVLVKKSVRMISCVCKHRLLPGPHFQVPTLYLSMTFSHTKTEYHHISLEV